MADYTRCLYGNNAILFQSAFDDNFIKYLDHESLQNLYFIFKTDNTFFEFNSIIDKITVDIRNYFNRDNEIVIKQVSTFIEGKMTLYFLISIFTLKTIHYQISHIKSSFHGFNIFHSNNKSVFDKLVKKIDKNIYLMDSDNKRKIKHSKIDNLFVVSNTQKKQFNNDLILNNNDLRLMNNNNNIYFNKNNPSSNQIYNFENQINHFNNKNYHNCINKNIDVKSNFTKFVKLSIDLENTNINNEDIDNINSQQIKIAMTINNTNYEFILQNCINNEIKSNNNQHLISINSQFLGKKYIKNNLIDVNKTNNLNIISSDLNDSNIIYDTFEFDENNKVENPYISEHNNKSKSNINDYNLNKNESDKECFNNLSKGDCFNNSNSDKHEKCVFKEINLSIDSTNENNIQILGNETLKNNNFDPVFKKSKSLKSNNQGNSINCESGNNNVNLCENSLENGANENNNYNEINENILECDNIDNKSKCNKSNEENPDKILSRSNEIKDKSIDNDIKSKDGNNENNSNE